jgi:hypothetical protein
MFSSHVSVLEQRGTSARPPRSPDFKMINLFQPVDIISTNVNEPQDKLMNSSQTYGTTLNAEEITVPLTLVTKLLWPIKLCVWLYHSGTRLITYYVKFVYALIVLNFLFARDTLFTFIPLSSGNYQESSMRSSYLGKNTNIRRL